MTLSDLQARRKRVPFVIIGLCILPYFWIESGSVQETELYGKTVVAAAAFVATFLYVGVDLRRPRWKKENEEHVGKQIRKALGEMVPQDLAVTDAEMQDLQAQIFKELTGVFWEGVDRNERLRAHKEHFYSNGIVYSTSIDVFMICGTASFVYAASSLATKRLEFAFVAALLVLIALVSRIFVTPRRRAHHLSLSAEQLDLLRREELEFVTSRFREIILEWRRKRLLQLD